MRKKNFFCICSDNLELITVIECISPSGLTIPPSFVLSAGPTPALDNLDVPIKAVATSPNGWTHNKLGAAWFERTFLPFTALLSPPQWQLPHVFLHPSALCPAHSSHLLSPAPATLLTSATPPAMGAPSDAMFHGLELESASQSVASHYFMWSQKHSSPAVSISIALDHSQAPIPSSVEEMGSEINRLRMMVNLMEKELVWVKAEAAASNTHCTIMA